MPDPSGPLVILCGINDDNEIVPVDIDTDRAIKTSAATVDASNVTYTPTTPADWDGGTDPGNQDNANDQLAERVKDLEEATVTVYYPKRGLVFPDELTVLAGNAQSFDVDDNCPYQWYGYHDTPADGDSASWSWCLEAGTYTLSVMHIAYTNRGKIDIYGKHATDGSYVLLASGIDLYAAGVDYDDIETASITLDTDGYWVFKYVVNGKHASSSDYYTHLIKMWIKPSTD